MEEEDDDFYGGGGQESHNQYDERRAHVKEEKMDMSDDQNEDEEEDSDDDVQFTLEKPAGVKSEPGTTSRANRQQTTSQERKVSSDTKAARAGTPLLQEGRTGSLPPTAVKGTFTHNGKEGKDFPEIRTSSIDVNGKPTWQANGKPITEVDIDADLAEHSKPWRLPGTDLTDFFNYGFDEYTWAQYCVRQKEMADSISEGKQRDAQMRAFFEGGGNNAPGGPPGMPPGMPAPPGMPGMGGMPDPAEMIQQMIAAGLDPSDQSQFMQFMAGMTQQSGGFGSGNQNSVSPHPHANQGFQAPQGPGGHHGQPDQGGFPGGMEGYSQQQLALMQQQGPQGGRGRGRGRGRW